MNENRSFDLPAADDFGDRIAAALRTREPSAAWTSATVDRIAGRLAEAAATGSAPARVIPLSSRHTAKVAATGVATSMLVIGAGVGVAAANPYSGFAAGVENAAHSVGLEWSFMPAGYTREQYQALWGSGYTPQDVDQLARLWHTDAVATKARAGQALIDGVPLPIRPGTSTTPAPSAADEARYEAAIKAGYDSVDIEKLQLIWHTDYMPTKAHLGELVLEGKSVPVAPSRKTEDNGSAQTQTAPAGK